MHCWLCPLRVRRILSWVPMVPCLPWHGCQPRRICSGGQGGHRWQPLVIIAAQSPRAWDGLPLDGFAWSLTTRLRRGHSLGSSVHSSVLLKRCKAASGSVGSAHTRTRLTGNGPGEYSGLALVGGNTAHGSREWTSENRPSGVLLFPSNLHSLLIVFGVRGRAPATATITSNGLLPLPLLNRHAILRGRRHDGKHGSPTSPVLAGARLAERGRVEGSRESGRGILYLRSKVSIRG